MNNKNWISIYTTSQFRCVWCERAKELLNIYGFDFYEKDINTDENYRNDFILRGHKTVPQVYIEGELIGGYEVTKKYLREKFFEKHPNKAEILEELEKLE